MRTIGAAALLLAAPGVLAAAPEPSRQASFRVGGVELQAPIPAGYCMPAGTEVDVAQLLAAGDDQNVTHLTLVRCRAPGAPERTGLGSDYILVKTPKQALLVEIGRDQMLAAMGQAFENPALAEALASGKPAEDAEKSLSRVIGDKIDLSGNVVPLGRDDVCAYLGGIVNVSTSTQSYRISLGACMTAVGGRLLAIYRYGPDEGQAGVARLLVKAKEFARTFAAVPPR